MAVDSGEIDLPEMIHEELLVCKICYCKYSMNADSLPKILACSHTVCTECINAYLSKSKKKSKFPCPFCRKGTVISKRGVAGLANNYTILGLIDLLQQNNQTGDTSGHKRSSKTIHGLSPTHTAYKHAASHVTSQQKYHTTARIKAEPGFADLGMNLSHSDIERPPPLNPDYAEQPTISASKPSDSSLLVSPSEKPDLPKRIPGAPSSLGRKKGQRTAAALLAMDRPESMNFPSAPPGPYDDVTSILSETIGSCLPQEALRVVSPPKPPPRRVSSESLAATPIKCFKKFGRYSEARMQTSAFTEPTRVACSEITGDILVIDAVQMTIQVFSKNGEYISLFKVLGIQGACFYTGDKIAAATHMGVDIYRINGEKVKTLSTGSSACIVPHKFGFIVAKTKTIQFFSNGLTQYKEINKVKLGKIKTTNFKCIQDLALNSLKDLIVLDSGRNELLILDTDGNLKFTVDPLKETCGAFKNPEAITIDKWNNILVSDSGNKRLLKFSANGNFARCLLNFRLWSHENVLQTRGVTVSSAKDKMIIVITGQAQAYVAIYGL